MKLISNKGNLRGIISEYENTPEYIEAALNSGFDVKIDLLLNDGKLFIGNDSNKIKLDIDWLEKYHNKLWLECKDINLIQKLNQLDNRGAYLNYFWHENDQYTLTSHRWIWTYPGKPLTKNSICVMPEWHYDLSEFAFDCYGVCSDYVGSMKKDY